MYTFSFIVGNIIPKSVKCIHSATKARKAKVEAGGTLKVMAMHGKNLRRSARPHVCPLELNRSFPALKAAVFRSSP